MSRAQFPQAHASLFFTIIPTVVVALFAVGAHAEIINIPHGCHVQVTNYTCGQGAMQMILDTPAVRLNNPNVVALLDNPPIPNFPCLNLIPYANPTQDQWVQYQLYCASRSRLGPNWFGPGTSPIALAATLNAYDGIPNAPALPNGIPQGGNPNHSYGWWNFPATIAGSDLASKTIVTAMKLTNVPAAASVNYGMHWVVVDGAQTSAPVTQNGNYQIQAIHVSDPGVGNCNAQFPSSYANLSGWYSYGFDIFGRPGLWHYVFTPTLVAPAPYYGRYHIVVEPPQPIPPDDGTFSGIPAPAPLLPTPLTASSALDHVQPLLDDPNSYLHDLFATGGSFDSSLATFMTLPDDVGGNGDWLIPFDGPAPGPDDLLGAISVDALTGVVNQASRLEGSNSLTLGEFHSHFGNLYDLNFPEDECWLPGDLNRDGNRNGRDIPLFITCVLNGGGRGCVCADSDANDIVDATEVGPFVAALLGS